jgi:hypothetical protein
MTMNEFTTMTELGKLFDESSHTIGKWLVDIGLRTPEMKTSKKAFDGGYVKQVPLPDNPDRYFWGWHRLKTIFALEAAGHIQVAHQRPGKLVGPFEARRSGINGFEIVSSDGTIAVWIIGEENANELVKLMNLAYQAGRFTCA